MYFNPLPRKRENYSKVYDFVCINNFNPLPRKRENLIIIIIGFIFLLFQSTPS